METQKFVKETRVGGYGKFDKELSADRLNATTGHVSIFLLLYRAIDLDI